MGMYKNTFVGPCIKIKNPTRTTTRGGERCPKGDCKNHKQESMSEKFCGKCGSKVERYSIHQPLSIFQLLDNQLHSLEVYLVISYLDVYYIISITKLHLDVRKAFCEKLLNHFSRLQR